MASRNRLSVSDSPPVNGTEQQQLDLFQNLEKLIASAVSICRLDGSVQCQIGGLITVIEELQRLLRHNFAEIKRLERMIEDQKYTSTRLEGNADEQKNVLTRLERNMEDQEHMFTNNITNLHYKVKGVQAHVDNLRIQMKEASERVSEVNLQENNESEKVNDPVQVDDGQDCSEELDTGSISNNLEVDSTEKVLDDQAQIDNGQGFNEGLETASATTSHNLEAESTEKDEPSHQVGDNEELDATEISKNLEVDKTGETESLNEGLIEDNKGATKDDLKKEQAKDATGVTDVSTPDCESSLDKEIVIEENNGGAISDKAPPFPESPPQDTPSTPKKAHPISVETPTSASKNGGNTLRVLRSSSKNTRKSYNHHFTRSFKNEDTSKRPSSSPLKSRYSRSPEDTKGWRKSASPRGVLGKRNLAGNTDKVSPSRKSMQVSPQRRYLPKFSRGASFSKDKKSPVTTTRKQRTKAANKIQKNTVNGKLPRKGMNSNIKMNAKVVKKFSPNRNMRNSGRHSTESASKINTSRANGRTPKREPTNESESRVNQTPTNNKASLDVPISEVNAMETYINLDFVLNANQLMSELVTDSSREEGTLDTASELERRDILKLAKLYRLRVRMAGKRGELPVALIKGRESSLPEPGEVDRLLYQMTRSMVLKRQVVKSKESMKLELSRRSMASPAKKPRV